MPQRLSEAFSKVCIQKLCNLRLSVKQGNIALLCVSMCVCVCGVCVAFVGGVLGEGERVNWILTEKFESLNNRTLALTFPPCPPQAQGNNNQLLHSACLRAQTKRDKRAKT